MGAEKRHQNEPLLNILAVIVYGLGVLSTSVPVVLARPSSPWHVRTRVLTVVLTTVLTTVLTSPRQCSTTCAPANSARRCRRWVLLTQLHALTN